jgi:ribonuclease J
MSSIEPSSVEPRSADGPIVEVVALGGLREFGMNLMAFVCGETCLVVDAGVSFPEAEVLGIDLIIPDLTFLQQRLVSALVLTHGHEDHIGAVPYLLPYVNGPVYGTALTLALVKRKLEEHGLDFEGRLQTVRPRQTVDVGPFQVEFIRVTHSMPDCVALALRTPVGTIVHTGDFKVDQTPLDGEHFDFHRFAELGTEGVLALFGDSTNVDRRGFSGSELDVVEAFEEIFTATTGKIVVAAFASSIYRMQVIVDLAAQFGRKVAFVGRGVVENSQTAMELGYLRMPQGVQIRDSEVRNFPASDVVCITTGSQGEAQAALPRIAIDDHRHVRLAEDDVVVFSARAIPGNERAIGRVMNHIAHRGAEVIYEGMKHVHVSGHGSEEELKLMLSLIRPRYFVPIHGEYRHLARHARVAQRVTRGLTEVLVVGNGEPILFDRGGARLGEHVPAGRVLIDGTRTGEIADEVLRDRRHLAGDGLVVPVVAIDRQTGAVEGAANVITRGLVLDERTEPLIRDASGLVVELIQSASIEERTDVGLIRERVRAGLQRAFRRRSGRRPLVVPVIMEI